MKEPKNRKDEFVVVRVTNNEKRKLFKLALKHKKSMSSLVRDLMFGTK